MGYSNLENQTYAAALTLAAAKNLDTVESRYCNTAYFSVVWKSTTGNTATVKLQDSADGTTWNDISGQSVTCSGGGGNSALRVDRNTLVAPLIRAVVTPNGETTGTVTIAYLLKGDR